MSHVLNRFCKRLQISDHYPSYSNESPNLHVEVLEIPSHRFEIRYRSVRIEKENHRVFWNFVKRLKAGVPFSWTPPALKHITDIQGQGGNGLALATAAGSLTVVVRNAPPNVKWLASEDMINFSNHSKVYSVMDDVYTDNAGKATITLNCPLKQALPEDTTVIGTGATFTLIRKPGTKPQSFTLEPAKDVDYAELEFIEFL